MSEIAMTINLRSILKQTARVYGAQLRQRPLTTRALTGGTLVALADTITEATKSPDKELDPYRMAFLFCFSSLVTTPFAHTWYRALDGRVARQLGLLLARTNLAPWSRRLGEAVGKTVIDQTVAAPIFTFGFFASRGYLDGLSFQAFVARLRRDFCSVLAAAMFFWPAAQLVNMGIVPAHLRVLFLQAAGFTWSLFACHLAVQQREAEQQQQRIRPASLPEVTPETQQQQYLRSCSLPSFSLVTPLATATSIWPRRRASDSNLGSQLRELQAIRSFDNSCHCPMHLDDDNTDLDDGYHDVFDATNGETLRGAVSKL